MAIAILPEDAALDVIEAARSVKSEGIIVEVGCFQCGTTIEIAQEIPYRRIIGMDAFGKDGALSTFMDVGYEQVLSDTAHFSNISLVQGNLVETVKTIQEPIACLFIDCDEYAPCDAAFEHLLKWIVPDGVIAIDDFLFDDIFKAADKHLEGWSMDVKKSGMVIARRK